jgi:hypothetical protein
LPTSAKFFLVENVGHFLGTAEGVFENHTDNTTNAQYDRKLVAVGAVAAAETPLSSEERNNRYILLRTFPEKACSCEATDETVASAETQTLLISADMQTLNLGSAAAYRRLRFSLAFSVCPS